MTDLPANEELLTIRQVAQIIGVTTKTIDNWVGAGLMPLPIKIGRKTVRFKRTTIEKWLQSNCKKESKHISRGQA